MFSNKNIHYFKCLNLHFSHTDFSPDERLIIYHAQRRLQQNEAMREYQKSSEGLEKTEKERKERMDRIKKGLLENDSIEYEGKLREYKDIESLANKISENFKKEDRLLIKAYIAQELIDELTKNNKALFKYLRSKEGKLNITFHQGVLTINNKSEKIVLNLIENKPSKELSEKVEHKREQIKEKSDKERTKLSQEIKEPKNLDSFINEDYKKYINKKNNTYTIDFKEKGRIDRKAQRQISLQKIFNLVGFKGYIEIEINGKTGAGRPNDCVAYYHSSQRKFMIKGGTERAKIFHGNKITLKKYFPFVERSRKDHIIEPETTKLTEQEKAQRLKEIKKRKQEEAEIREELIYNKDLSLWQEYSQKIFDNKIFSSPKFLREDEDFKANWERIDPILESALSQPPFDLKTPESGRKYIQRVTQRFRNSKIHPSDFFKYKMEGRYLYKGGYDKFKEDYDKLKKKELNNTISDSEMDKLYELTDIVFGIARLLDSLNRLKVYKKQIESPEERYHYKIVGITEMTDKEKEEVKKIPSNNYHNLKSLLHKNEDGPAGLSIGVSNSKINQLKTVIKSAAMDVPPPFDINKYLAGPESKGGLKLLFMAYGLDELIKKGCIKKYDDERYILVKVPSNNALWLATLMRVKQESAELWDTNKESFKKWQRIRETLDTGVKAKEFIATIFSPLSKDKVKQEINWWQKLCHFDFKNEKKISMAYLGNVTLNPSDYEKHMVYARGYYDMIEKTTKRAEGTTIYEPQETEIVKLTNRYLEYGLLASFMQTTKEDLPKVTKRIVKEFGLQGKVIIKEPYEENKIENLQAIHEQIMLKDMNRNMLSEAHIKFIRLGHIMGRQVETSKNWSESMQEVLSSNPMYRKIQLEALKQGCPVGKLDEVAQRIHVALFGYSEGIKPPHAKAIGGAVGIDLGKWMGQNWKASFALVGTNGKVIPAAGIGAAIKAGEKLTIRWNIGTTIGFTGASVGLEFPVSNEWDMFLNAGAGISWSGGTVGIGAGIGARWDQKRAEKLNEKESHAKRGVEQIQAELKNGNIEKAAKLILSNETFGAYMQHLKDKLNLPDDVICEIYKNAEKEWTQKAREGVKIPPVLGFGAGVFMGLNGTNLPFGGGGAYITFKIPGTEVTYVVRHEHPKYSERTMRSIANEELKKHLAKEGLKNTVISKKVISASSGLLYFDYQQGRSHVSRPKNLQEAQQSVAVRESENEANLSEKSSFDAIKQTFASVDIHAEKVKDPKNPKGNLIALTPLQTAGSNVEMLIDPKLKSKGLILDKENNRVLLAASDAKKLLVTRTRYRYPYTRMGALNIDVIAFRDRADRTNIEIREESPQYIYKYEGEKYTIVQGEARTGLESEKSNTTTIDEYKKRQRKFESFVDHKFEHSIEEGRELTGQMYSTLEVGEMPKIRTEKLELQDFGKEWFEKNKTTFDKRIGTISSLEAENTYKKELFGKLQEDFRGFATNQNIKLESDFSLNDAELNLVYNQLLNESFTRVRKGGNDRLITKRLEKRNELFKNFMTDHIKKFKEANPEQWALIKQIDPSMTVESIVNYLVLTMPQNAQQLREFDAGTSLEIGEGLKYATYTRKKKPNTKNQYYESIPSSFGVKNPENFKDMFQILNPTELKVNSTNPMERATARLVLQMMSPVHLEKLDTLEGKEKFLYSELSLTVISLYDEKMKVSPLIQVMGKTNYQGMIQIYKALNNRQNNPEQFRKALETHKKSFEIFKQIVAGIRRAQINGDKAFVFDNKYIFHLEETSMHSGPYLKCANGTITMRQRIGITTTEEKVQKWYAPDKKGYNILIESESKKAFKTLTAGYAHGFRPEEKPPPPDRKGDMPKENITTPRKGGDNTSESTATGV